jgi:hypothetical protein
MLRYGCDRCAEALYKLNLAHTGTQRVAKQLLIPVSSISQTARSQRETFGNSLSSDEQDDFQNLQKQEMPISLNNVKRGISCFCKFMKITAQTYTANFRMSPFAAGRNEIPLYK